MLMFFWVLFAVAVGINASNRGRSGVGWFFLSLLISPLLGLLFVAVSKDLSSKPGATPSAPSAATHVKCPACAEWVLPEAKVCKHCGSQLTPVTGFKTGEQLQAEKEREESKNLMIGVIAIAVVIAIAAAASALGK
ncbi:MAG: hypothetical protein KF871_14000 [Hydrogenophaga sp.]|uniref:hypothetical protein n=1 Tax=Hydrogenophaga sp. TaxID=1904254 RepID=UPI001D64283E|nr:hypothetical protein [Hydrogenophaga sp.]MBX3610999.1 hypothetical protein [Hydrogenophaga sp.]